MWHWSCELLVNWLSNKTGWHFQMPVFFQNVFLCNFMYFVCFPNHFIKFDLQVLQVGGVLFILLGMIGKIGSIFVTIPDPVIGGILLVMFGMVTSVGLTTLQYVDLNSRRYL